MALSHILHRHELQSKDLTSMLENIRGGVVANLRGGRRRLANLQGWTWDVVG
jgi:hypothetical protein